MNRSTIYVALTLFFVVSAQALADGKMLIFSVPADRTGGIVDEPEKPLRLVDSNTPEYLKLHLDNAARDSRIELERDSLPSNLLNRSSFNGVRQGSYHFPVPDPVPDISGFGFSNIHVFYRASLFPWKYAHCAVLNEMSNLSTEMISSDKQQINTSHILESLWKETYSGEIACNDPQLAHSLKASVDNLINHSLKDPISNGQEFVPSSDEASAHDFFNNPDTRVIIAWNGKDNAEGVETMIVSTLASCAYRGKRAATLSIIPLPGPPIDIKRANPRAFYEAKSLFCSRTPTTTATEVEPNVVTPTRIGSHNIFVWRIENIQDFYNQVTRYVSYKYRGRAYPWLEHETLRIVEFYLRKNFHYFAFDLTEVGSNSEKETIAYTFKTPYLYYPLVINRVGGSDDYSAFDLILITPGMIKPRSSSAIQKILPPDRPALAKDSATLVRGTVTYFSLAEVRGIDKNLAVFDSETDKLTVRNIKFKKRCNSFTKDLWFQASGALDNEPSSSAVSNIQRPSSPSAVAKQNQSSASPAINKVVTKEETPVDSKKENIDKKTGSESGKTADKGADPDESAEPQPISDPEAPKEEDPASPSAESEKTDGPIPAPVPETENNVTSDPENK